SDYTDRTQLPLHVERELKRFFQDYKVLENKMVEVDDILGPQDAYGILRSSLDMYRALRRGELRSSPRSRPTPPPGRYSDSSLTRHATRDTGFSAGSSTPYSRL